jgi:hypothetical protein
VRDGGERNVTMNNFDGKQDDTWNSFGKGTNLKDDFNLQIPQFKTNSSI